MDIAEAFRHALDGDAILFLGAGFSLGATNEQNDPFPLGLDLSKDLMAALGEAERVPLQTAAELYINVHGETGLLNYLKKRLGVSKVANYHRSFARPRWRRVYTTNYDDVFEFANREQGLRVRPLTLDSPISHSSKKEVDCIHINGYLPIANAYNFNSAVILSETAYLTNRFRPSPWATLFRNDIDRARAVIFAGYSVSDLDIGRILIAVDRVRSKCVFIVGQEPSLSLKTTVQKFGTISPADTVQVAATILEELEDTHRPARPKLYFSSFPEAAKPTLPKAQPTAKEVFDLFVKGEVNQGQLSRALTDPSSNYAVRRREVADAVSSFEAGNNVVLLLSRLANGKTVMCEAIAQSLQDQFEIRYFTKETLSIDDEIGALRNPARPTIIVVDDYPKHISIIRNLRLGAAPEQYMLLTSRTPAHLTHKEQLLDALGEVRISEHRVDTLGENELEHLDSILAAAGLLGDVAKWPKPRRIQQLYREKGAAEFGGILLWLFESPQIRARLAEIFSGLRGKGEAQRVVIAAMILAHFGQVQDIDDIATFVGAHAINQAIFSEDRSVANLVRFDQRTVYPRSSLFAVATLRALWSEGNVPTVLEDMLRSAWDLRADSKRFRSIARDLMRYSLVRRIVPQENWAVHVRAYYDRIRNLPSCANNQLFWLQFALADIAQGDFAIAEQHLNQSYSIAARLKGFDTYQIDNVKALFLLLREVQRGPSDSSFRVFVEISGIINRQLRERRTDITPIALRNTMKSFGCVL